MQAIVLAGGFGTRLKGAIGEEIPKPMAPINGEPFLAHYLRYLRGQGITSVLLSTHHLRATIRDYFGSGFEGLSITYAEEEKPLGTGGAVKFALSVLKPVGPVFVSNGDSFVEIDVAEMVAAHEKSGSTLTIALREMPDCSRYGEAVFDANHRITEFVYPGRAHKGWISTGVYVVSPEIFKGFDLSVAFSFESDFQRPHLARVKPHAWETGGYFIDIGVPEDYARAQRELKGRIEAA